MTSYLGRSSSFSLIYDEVFVVFFGSATDSCFSLRLTKVEFLGNLPRVVYFRDYFLEILSKSLC